MTLATLIYHLDLKDEATWNKNKEMLGYKPNEKYEDFFFRKHGYKHTEQVTFSTQVNVDLETQLRLLRDANTSLRDANAVLRSENTIRTQNIQELTIKLNNMELQLEKLVKGYKPVSKLLLRDY